MALDTNTLADNVDIENTVVSVVPTHGAVVRADYKTRVGVESADDADEKRESSSFWLCRYGQKRGSSIAGENGQVYLSGNASVRTG